MSLLGKILLVFNLLAGGGFVYLATQDLKGRQTTTAAGLRHILLVRGFPLEGASNFDEEGGVAFHVEMAGDKPTDYVSRKLLESYFAQAGNTGTPTGPVPLGGPAVVTNQIDEVKRVRGLIEGAIEAAPQKASVITGYLLFQA